MLHRKCAAKKLEKLMIFFFSFCSIQMHSSLRGCVVLMWIFFYITLVDHNSFTTMPILSRSFSCQQKSSDRFGSEFEHLSTLECLLPGHLELILWALWVMCQGVCGLSLLPTDALRSHQTGIWVVLRIVDHFKFLFFLALFLCLYLLYHFCHILNLVQHNIRLSKSFSLFSKHSWD